MAASQLTDTSNIVRHLRLRIIEHTALTPVARRLVLDAPELARDSRPGQFVHVRCTDTDDPLLRRPLSVHDADPETGQIALLYEIVGRGTALLAERRPGEELDILGPLGNGFTLPESADQPLLLIAGGIAVAPLYYVARRLAETVGSERMAVLIGARAKCLLLCLDQYRRFSPDVRIATDDGSTGYHGFVTGLLTEYIRAMDRSNPPLVYTCGPMPMLRAVSRITTEHGLKSQVSTEEKMACGVGACMGCAIKVRDGDGSKYVRCCKEGPVFDADEVVWE